MIICSAIVAARAGLDPEHCDDREFVVLGVVVAAGTAIEAWLKPREKWKGFMGDTESSEDVLLRLQNTDPADIATTDKLRVEFNAILAAHREKNVF